MEMPEINCRVKQLVDYYAGGSVKKFAESIKIPQQTVNRLFNIDSRTGKYPMATTDLIVAITEMYVGIEPRWLLTGKAPMLREENSTATTIERDPRDIELIATQRQLLNAYEQGYGSRGVGVGSVPTVDYPSTSGLKHPRK